MTAFPKPSDNPLNAPFWSALAEGKLVFQKCNHCGHAWLPGRAECPTCLRADFQWARSGGRAKLVSWVVYHRAFHDAFKERVPYTVAIVELAEGPRLMTNVLGDASKLKMGHALALTIEREDNVFVPRFTVLS